MKTSPLKADPSRTITLRRKFAQALRRRFAQLKGAINRLIVQSDAFGLTVRNEDITPMRWQFLSSDQQVERFEQWMATQTEGITQDDLWEQYIQESYAKGQGRAWNDAMAARLATTQDAGFMAGTRAEFLTSAFNHPPSVEKVKLLAARVYSDLTGITEAMGSQIKRELVDGLIQGDNPRTIARRINDRVDKIGRTRATTLARTEVIRAHAEGQLDAFERLGVADIGVGVEWDTAGFNVCPLCAPMDGAVFSIQESRGLIPRHPNCRCVFLPANVGESRKGQKRAQGSVKRSVDKSIKAEIPKTSKRTLAEQKTRSRWAGADRWADKRKSRKVKKQPEKTVDTMTRVELAKKHSGGELNLAIKSHVEKTAVKRNGFVNPQTDHPEDMVEFQVAGVTYLCPPSDVDRVVAQVASLMRTTGIPDKLISSSKRVIFTAQPNKWDSYWAKQYNTPGFVSQATGGDGTIDVYRRYMLDKDTFTHESGHNFANELWGSTTPKPSSAYGKAQKLELPVSDYGANSPDEDFAEACRMYSNNNRIVPNRPSEREELEKNFPLKYKALKDLFGD